MQVMNSATIPLVVAIVLQIALGSVVFLANPKRAANQCFLLLSLAIIGWLSMLYLAFTTTSATVAGFAIREASVAGALILVFFKFLRLSIRERRNGWPAILKSSRLLLLVSGGIIVFCQTRLFLQDVRMPPPEAIGIN